ncbi:MAG TPA: M48 family metallopeptidase [Chthonomonadales bacterium]|nr:M48 family metallopeptidase [Chthonomonadales bacterium]
MRSFFRLHFARVLASPLPVCWLLCLVALPIQGQTPGVPFDAPKLRPHERERLPDVVYPYREPALRGDPLHAIPEIIRERPKPPEKSILLHTSPKITRYNRIRYTLYFAAVGWNLLGLGLAVVLGLGANLRQAIESRTHRRFWQVVFFYAVFSLGLLLWNLPPALTSYLTERSYGFSTRSPLLWLADLGRNYLFGLVNIPAVWLGYWLLERSPKRWWLWLALASIPWSLATTVLWPVLVAPAYNRFEPLHNAKLHDRLLNLAERAGIRSAKVYQVDISRRTTRLNAYVAGLGPTKRIVLWDTTLKALSEDEIVAIMGHEMGHYVLGHVWWRFAAGVVGAFILLWILSKLLPWSVGRFGQRVGIRAVHDLAGLPLVMLLLSALLFLQTPLESAFSRFQERQADRFGLELTGLDEATARAYITFVERDYADPDPPAFIVFWLYSHPPIRERIAFAQGHSTANP